MLCRGETDIRVPGLSEGWGGWTRGKEGEVSVQTCYGTGQIVLRIWTSVSFSVNGRSLNKEGFTIYASWSVRVFNEVI